MDASHGYASAITALLVPVIVWLSHWPLQPLDKDIAAAIAGLLVAAVHGGFVLWRAYHPVRSAEIIEHPRLSG